MKEFYFLLFFTLYRINGSRQSRAYNEWKAVVFVTILQFFVLVLVDRWLLASRGIYGLSALPKGFVFLACVGVVALNNRALVHDGRWESYATRYSAYPPSARRVRTGLVVAFIVMVLSLMGHLLYEAARDAPTGRVLG